MKKFSSFLILYNANINAGFIEGITLLDISNWEMKKNIDNSVAFGAYLTGLSKLSIVCLMSF